MHIHVSGELFKGWNYVTQHLGHVTLKWTEVCWYTKGGNYKDQQFNFFLKNQVNYSQIRIYKVMAVILVITEFVTVMTIPSAL